MTQSQYLIQTTEIYRVESEAAAVELIEAAKQDKNLALIKYSNEHKEKKQKGEVIDSWNRVTLVKSFTDEKLPVINHTVKYEVDL